MIDLLHAVIELKCIMKREREIETEKEKEKRKREGLKRH